MVNVGDTVIFIKNGKNLHNAVIKTLREVKEYLYSNLINSGDIISDSVEDAEGGRNYYKVCKYYQDLREMVYFNYFSPDQYENSVLDVAFVEAVASLAIGKGKGYRGDKDDVKNIELFISYSSIGYIPTTPVSKITRIKMFSKLILVALWCNKVIIIPSIFNNTVTDKHKSFFDKKYTEVIKFIGLYRKGLSHRPEKAALISKNSIYELNKRGKRLILSTDWHSFKDVNVLDMAILNDARISSQRGDEGAKFSKSPFPFSLILSELILCKEHEVSFTKEQFERYSLYRHAGSVIQEEISLIEFVEKTDEDIELIFMERVEQKRILCKKYDEKRKRKRKRKASDKDTKDHKLIDISNRGGCITEGLLEEYYCNLSEMRRNSEWLSTQAFYPGRENAIDIKKESKIWLLVYKSYIEHRSNIKGFQTHKGIRLAFVFLMDYILLYLPWWNELNKENAVNIPKSPKEFSRYLFVSRVDESDKKIILPKTLLSMIGKRCGRTTMQSIVRDLEIFFLYISQAFADVSKVWELGSIPFRRILDSPVSSRPAKSTKIPFQKGVYPHMIQYLYALESLGMYMTEKALYENKYQGSDSTRKVFNTGTKGDIEYVPIVFSRGKIYPIFKVPNIFRIVRRSLKITKKYKNNRGGYSTKTYNVSRKVPVLSVLRLFMCAIETGLRVQSWQWLDLFDWDLSKTNDNEVASYSQCYINTDKTHGPFVIPINYRVRGALLREQQFQLSRTDMDLKAINYEDREVNPFDNIIPMFRGVGEKPISDSKYAEEWLRLLVGFEFYYNSLGKADYTCFVYEKGSEKNVKADVESYMNAPTTKFLKSHKAITTPHGSRNTFIGEKREYLDIEDIKVCVAHSSSIVTAYYFIPEFDDLVKKLKASDDAMFDIKHDSVTFDRSNCHAVRADSAHGYLRSAFESNRGAVLNQDHFVSIRMTVDPNDEDGISMLRATPMRLIVFRETHICPVGEICPEEVLKIIIEKKRCGLCPLSVSHIDHLKAITQKRYALLYSAKCNTELIRKLEKSGESDEVLDELWETKNLDFSEACAWQLTEEILIDKLKNCYKAEIDNVVHVDAPEMVRKHLIAVTKKCNEKEWLLRLLASSNEYPTLQNPEIRAIADKERMRLLASTGNVDDLLADIQIGCEVEILAGYLNTLMSSKKILFSDISDALTKQDYRKPTALSNKLLIFKD